jgi:hypothetical protein
MRGNRTALESRKRYITLTTLLKAAKRNTELGIRTVVPGRVLTFDPATQRASVELDQIISLKGEGGSRQLRPVIIPSAKVRFPVASGGASYMTFPILPGDNGHVYISDRSLEKWDLSDGLTAVDPELRHTHNVVDGIFEPGLRPRARAIPNFDMTAAVMESALIRIGEAATESAVLGNAMLALYNAFVASFNSHTHVVAGVTAGMGSVTSATPIAQADPMVAGTHTSTKVLIGNGAP